MLKNKIKKIISCLHIKLKREMDHKEDQTSCIPAALPLINLKTNGLLEPEIKYRPSLTLARYKMNRIQKKAPPPE